MSLSRTTAWHVTDLPSMLRLELPITNPVGVHGVGVHGVNPSVGIRWMWHIRVWHYIQTVECNLHYAKTGYLQAAKIAALAAFHAHPYWLAFWLAGILVTTFLEC